MEITEDHTRLYVDVGFYGYVSSAPACSPPYNALPQSYSYPNGRDSEVRVYYGTVNEVTTAQAS